MSFEYHVPMVSLVDVAEWHFDWNTPTAGYFLTYPEAAIQLGKAYYRGPVTTIELDYRPDVHEPSDYKYRYNGPILDEMTAYFTLVQNCDLIKSGPDYERSTTLCELVRYPHYCSLLERLGHATAHAGVFAVNQMRELAQSAEPIVLHDNASKVMNRRFGRYRMRLFWTTSCGPNFPLLGLRIETIANFILAVLYGDLVAQSLTRKEVNFLFQEANQWLDVTAEPWSIISQRKIYR